MSTWPPDTARRGGPLGDTLLDRVRERIVLDPRTSGGGIHGRGDLGPVSHDTVVRALRSEGVILGDESLAILAAELLREFEGYGRLDPLMRTPGVTDVLVNSVHGTWMDCGAGLQPVEHARFADEGQVRALAQRLADSVGRRLDEASPWVDAQLADGARLHALIPPLAVDGTLISIRIPARRDFDLAALQRAGAVDEFGASWLRALIDARLTFLVTGGTGSGKTTVLGALLGEVSHGHRIVIAEDSTELDPRHPHCVRLQSRTANIEGAGAIVLRDLVRQALRMRPDRIVVGEVRGPEVLDLLAAFNTGHEGCCGTVHANEARDVPARLEALALTAGVPRAALHALVAAGLDAIVHLTRVMKPDGTRVRVVEGIHVVSRGNGPGLSEQGDPDIATVVAGVSFRSGEGRACAGPGHDALVSRMRARGVVPPSADGFA